MESAPLERLTDILDHLGALEDGATDDFDPATPSLFEPILNAIDTAVFLADANGNLRYANAAWQRLTGFSLADTRELTQSYYLHPRDQDRWVQFLYARKDAPPAASILVLRFLTRSGETIYLEASAQPLVSRSGVCKGFVGTLSEVGSRVQEEGLKQASHRTLETLINNLPGLVYRCRNNRQWTMEYMSGGCELLTGYPPEALINSERLTYADLIVHEDREQVWQNVQVSLRDNRPFELMYRIRTARGDEKWVLERGRGNFSESGELLGVEGFITDVTQEKSAQLRLRSDILLNPGTSLPTPALFLDRLQMALRRRKAWPETTCTVLVVQLDQFAKWRETLDADFLEPALLEVGERLEGVLTPVDSVCLWTDTEFAILHECREPEADAAALSERIQRALRTPVSAGNRGVFLTTSIGATVGLTGDEAAEDVVSFASTAASRARNAGLGRVEICAVSAAPDRAQGRPSKG